MLEILIYPDPRLKRRSDPVSEFDAKLHLLLDGMAEAMYRANGIGLAAPQVDETKRLFLIDLGAQKDEPKKLWEFINPKLSLGAGRVAYEEGCLSVPGFTEEVNRKLTIRVDYQDRHGNSHTLEAEGLLAVALQHENDHLDGVLFVDRVSPFKRQWLRRRIAKAAQVD